MLRTLTALVALAASATLAGCGAATGGDAGTDAGGVTVVAPASTPAAPRDVVMIIRHGEKPDGSAPGLDEDGNEDDSSLTAVGWQRAHGLVDLFDPARGTPRPGLAVPERIYAAGVTDDGEGQRTRETVAPLGAALGIPVDTDLGRGDADLVAARRDPRDRRRLPVRLTGATEGVARRPVRHGLDTDPDHRRLALHPDASTRAAPGQRRRHRELVIEN